MPPSPPTPPLRIANCHGFGGDRFAAAAEMVAGGPIDVLCGDWLGGLPPLLLARERQRDPALGYARSFVDQMEAVLAGCLERGIKVVTNAGGVAPRACGAALEHLAGRLGLPATVAVVPGSDLTGRFDALQATGIPFSHAETGAPLGDREVLAADAALGCRGIAEALRRGADIVVTGRVAEAALVVGPAAWHHRWARHNWDALAGAAVAGHVLAGGTEATGGNYAFFDEVPGLDHPGFPIAEVAHDGSSTITKHARHGGLVSVGTVTARLLHGITGPWYRTPDVTARLDTAQLHADGPDRVRISAVKGESPASTIPVTVAYDGGFRATATVNITGLDIEAKAAAAERTLWREVDHRALAAVDVRLVRHDHADPATYESARAELQISVADPDETKVGGAFAAALAQLAGGSAPGLYVTGPDTRPYPVEWTTLVPAHAVRTEIEMGGTVIDVEGPAHPEPPVLVSVEHPRLEAEWTRQRRPRPLGLVAGARSGATGRHATLGVWARSSVAFVWLARELTVERLQQLLPETAPRTVVRHELPNLRALHFVVTDLLGGGAGPTAGIDAGARGLGEYLRAKLVDIPLTFLDES